MNEEQVALKFIEHLMANLNRLHRSRHLLYGLYLAMIGSFLSIYYTKSEVQRPTELLLSGALIGQAILVMQLVISYHIQGNNNTLNWIFNQVRFVEQLNELARKLMSRHRIFGKYSPAEYPYSFALGLMSIANVYFLGYYSKLGLLPPFAFNCPNCTTVVLFVLFWAIFILAPICIWLHLSRIFSEHRKELDATKMANVQ